MARLKLKVEKRKIFGRKVKKLRHEGILPANLYGKKIKSQAVQLGLKEFLPVFQEVGETGLIDLIVGKEKSARPVLVHNVQFDPVGDQAIHVDFRQVSLTEKVKAEIPIELTGESPVVEQKLGILVKVLDEVEVEALPADLPEKIEVNISGLEKVDEMIKIEDIKFDKKKLTVLTESSRLVVKIEPPTKIEQEKPQVEEEVTEEAEGQSPELVEGEASTEAEKPAEEKTKTKEGKEKKEPTKESPAEKSPKKPAKKKS